MLRVWKVTTLATIFLGTFLCAQSFAGGSGAYRLEIPDAAALAVGGAMVGQANTPVAVFFNPAGMTQIKQAGLVDSVRGRDGGYLLVRDSKKLTIGEVILIVQGPITLVDCFLPSTAGQCPFEKDCVFWPVWEKAHHALLEVLNATTFDDLVNQDSARCAFKNFTYAI